MDMVTLLHKHSHAEQERQQQFQMLELLQQSFRDLQATVTRNISAIHPALAAGARRPQSGR